MTARPASIHARRASARTPGLFAVIRGWFRRLTAVNELEQLSDRALRDIGIERGDIERVARRELARIHASDLIRK